MSRGLSGMGHLCGGEVGASWGTTGVEVVAGSSRKDSGVRDGDEADGGVEWGVAVEARERVHGVVAGSGRSRTGSGVALMVGSAGEGVARILGRTKDEAGIILTTEPTCNALSELVSVASWDRWHEVAASYNRLGEDTGWSW